MRPPDHKVFFRKEDRMHQGIIVYKLKLADANGTVTAVGNHVDIEAGKRICVPMNRAKKVDDFYSILADDIHFVYDDTPEGDSCNR